MSSHAIAGTLFGVICFITHASSAFCGEPNGAPPKEGRIQNLDTKPFAFRLARTRGASWTDTITLAPGEVITLKSGAEGNADDIEGITGNGKGHVTIDYAELDGRVRLQLPAINHPQNVYMPYWFHVRDANGFSRLVQAENKEAAAARHKDLLAEPPLTPTEIVAVKRMLRANFMLSDK